MSNGNVFERLWKLLATANKLVLDGKRDAESFCQLLQAFIEEKPSKVWKTWKTIKLGTGLQTADDFLKKVMEAGMKIGDWANDILGKPAFTATTSETEVELVVASVAELGFKDGATRKDIYVRAQEFGLDLCPPEVGPQLRLQYTDQPRGEWLVIAMEPITDSDGDLDLFVVAHDDDERWLYAYNGYPAHFWNGHSRFVFLRRK
jgi:hypothetical protein